MKPVTITIKPSGSISIEGEVVLQDRDGNPIPRPVEKRPGIVKLCGCGRSKTHRAATVKLDFTGQTPVGPCPKCKGNVFESETDYICEHSQREKKRCTFKTGKVILSQPIERDQVARLLKEGKTDYFDQFISKSGKPFKARLVLQDKGKVGFDFPEE